jgi:hypothetical protein
MPMQDWFEHNFEMLDESQEICVTLTTCTMIVSVQSHNIHVPITKYEEHVVEATFETEITWNEILKQFHKVNEWMD